MPPLIDPHLKSDGQVDLPASGNASADTREVVAGFDNRQLRLTHIGRGAGAPDSRVFAWANGRNHCAVLIGDDDALAPEASASSADRHAVASAMNIDMIS